MLYCNNCKKEVIILDSGGGSNAGLDEELDEFSEHELKEGKILMYNPPPNPPYYCPKCKEKLIQKKV